MFENIDWKNVGKIISNAFTGLLDFSDKALYQFDYDKIFSSLWTVISNIDWKAVIVKLARHILLIWVKFGPVGTIIHFTLKAFEFVVNKIIGLFNNLKINVPEGLQELLGLPETIGFEYIEPIRVDEGEAINSMFDWVEKELGISKEELADEGENAGGYYAGGVTDGIADNITESGMSTLLNNVLNQNEIATSCGVSTAQGYQEGFESQENSVSKVLGAMQSIVTGNLDQSKNSGSWGKATMQEYQKGIDNQSDPVSKVLGAMQSIVTGNLDQSKNSGSWGKTTMQEYQKGIDSQNNPVSKVLGAIKSIITGNLDQSKNSSSWGKSTLQEYKKGVDNQSDPVSKAIGTIKSMITGNLDQSKNSSSWGKSTLQEYKKGIDNQNDPVSKAIGTIKSIITGNLNQSNNSSSWGKSTMQEYNRGLGTQNDPISKTIGTVQGIITGNLSSSKSYYWGQDMIQGFINGINAKTAALNGIMKGVASGVAAYVHFSRPDKGPLRDYENWMPDMIMGLSSSLLKAMPRLSSTMSYASESLMRAFTENTLPNVDGAFADGVGSNIILGIANKASAANSDNTSLNMSTATYGAISRALAENRNSSTQKIVVNVGNKTVYEGYGTYRDEQSKMLGVNT